MNRTTIDFGIDLGTTNSAIAVLKGVEPEIIKNNSDADITSSAVSIDKRGGTRVGLRAKNLIADSGKIDAHIEFKRQMGTDHEYVFESSSQRRKPEELSAEVLKELKGSVQQRSGEAIEAAVITVPAAFELHQCDATNKAAQLAGVKVSPLLQEPVAAALAYGFQAGEQRGYWLVYDFGGGTFDAAIIKSEEGVIQVVDHGGDNFLGGSDIDWSIVEKILAPRIVNEHRLQDFSRSNKRWRQAFAKLKREAELAKVDLSSRTSASVGVKFTDDDGEEIDFECDLERDEVIRLAEPFILRSVEICQRVLKAKNLGKDAIDKAVLVGGPTLAPYFREILAGKLGIPLDHSVDPLTVVARGAAVFAGAQKISAVNKPVQVGEYRLELADSFNPVGPDDSPLVGGKIVGASTQNFSGFTLELVNPKTLWRSGRVSLREDGVFITNLHAEPGVRNVFNVELLDAGGRRQRTTPDAINYTIGAVIEEQPLINSMGIAKGNNDYPILCLKGNGLPTKATGHFRTIQALRQGRAEDVCRIPVVEGEKDLADRNRLNGILEIRGDMIRRDLPAGSDVEVTLKIDKSRLVTVEAYIPLLDEDFSAQIHMLRRSPIPEQLEQDYQAEMQRFREAKAKATKAGGGNVEAVVRAVEDLPLLDEVKTGVIAAKGDADAAVKAEKGLLELKVKLDEALDAIEWPSLVSEARGWLKDLRGSASRDGTPDQRDKAEELADHTETIIREHKVEPLRKQLDKVRRLYFDILFAQPAFWVREFERLTKQQDGMSDQNRAGRLIDQGRECIAKNNPTGLQNIVRQLWDLLPREVVETAQRGYRSGVI